MAQGTCSLIGLTLILLATALPLAAEPLRAAGTVEVSFSPGGGATAAVVRELNSARTEILVQAYSFTSKLIAKALLEAKKRGVKVVAVLDKSQRRERYSAASTSDAMDLRPEQPAARRTESLREPANLRATPGLGTVSAVYFLTRGDI